MEIIVWAVCIMVGWALGSGKNRAGEGALWGLFLGPIGWLIILFRSTRDEEATGAELFWGCLFGALIIGAAVVTLMFFGDQARKVGIAIRNSGAPPPHNAVGQDVERESTRPVVDEGPQMAEEQRQADLYRHQQEVNWAASQRATRMQSLYPEPAQRPRATPRRELTPAEIAAKYGGR